MSSPTSRTLELLREEGWTAQVVERWNPHSRTRLDLFGCIDVIAVHPERGTLAVQACAVSSQAARVAKVMDEWRMRICLAAGWRVEVWAWGKRKKKRGGKAMRWHVTRTPITLDHDGLVKEVLSQVEVGSSSMTTEGAEHGC